MASLLRHSTHYLIPVTGNTKDGIRSVSCRQNPPALRVSRSTVSRECHLFLHPCGLSWERQVLVSRQCSRPAWAHTHGMTEGDSSGTQRPFDWVARWWLALCCPDSVGPGCIEQMSFCLLSCGNLRLATCWRIPASHDAWLYPSCSLLSFCVLTATTSVNF